jgi:hypothetical protein
MTIDEAIDSFGQAELIKTMTRFGWFPFLTPYSYDKRKIDFECRNEWASIDVQLKSRNFGERDQNWVFEIIESGEQIDNKFYGQSSNFLFVIGFNRVEQWVEEFIPPDSNSLPLTLPEKIEEHPKADPNLMALIPAKKVKEKLTAKSLNISKKKLEKEGYEQWDEYIGLVNIKRTLEVEKRRQLRIRSDEEE